MNRLAKLLDGRERVLFDGGMGTLLQERGLDEGRPGELWNVERARRRSARFMRSTPRPGGRSSPPTPSAAPARGSRCTASATGSSS